MEAPSPPRFTTHKPRTFCADVKLPVQPPWMLEPAVRASTTTRNTASRSISPSRVVTARPTMVLADATAPLGMSLHDMTIWFSTQTAGNAFDDGRVVSSDGPVLTPNHSRSPTRRSPSRTRGSGSPINSTTSGGSYGKPGCSMVATPVIHDLGTTAPGSSHTATFTIRNASVRSMRYRIRGGDAGTFLRAVPPLLTMRMTEGGGSGGDSGGAPTDPYSSRATSSGGYASGSTLAASLPLGILCPAGLCFAVSLTLNVSAEEAASTALRGGVEVEAEDGSTLRLYVAATTPPRTAAAASSGPQHQTTAVSAGRSGGGAGRAGGSGAGAIVAKVSAVAVSEAQTLAAAAATRRMAVDTVAEADELRGVTDFIANAWKTALKVPLSAR